MFEVVIVIVSALMCASVSSVSSVSSASSGQPPKPPNPRVIHIAGFGALTGPVQSFGINSRAAQLAAADAINRAGGVRLADGSKARLEITYEDDKCNPEQAIDLIRTVASSDALVATGPSCSSVAEPLFSALQHRVGDAQDHGIQLPILTDGATKAGLARLSEWAFRNVADEHTMYRALWQWVRRTHPTLKTVFGGEEADFAHSHSTWDNIIRATAQSSGLNLTGAAKWSLTDTRFDAPVAQMKAAHPDIVVLSAHATTTCGVLREMAKQGVRPKLTVGLTSAASDETLHRCGALAQGLLIPTTFAPITPEARRAAAAVVARHGLADLHSMAAWENIMTLKRVIESARIVGTHETVAADRMKIRDGLSRLDTIAGLLGTVRRTPDRESRKPFVFVQVTRGTWRVVHGPIAAEAAEAAESPNAGSSPAGPAGAAGAAIEEQVRIPGDPQSLTLFLRHLPAAHSHTRQPRSSVLFVHGATFPSALAAAYKFNGRSWMDDVSEAGFDVWALDFPGYGGSSRYAEMDEPADAHEPLGRADICARQIERAVEFIRARQRIDRLSIVAHSWGTLVAGLYATQHADRVERLVLFGPIALRHQPMETSAPAAWRYVTEEYQWSRFQREVPAGEAPVFPHASFDPWVAAYLSGDPSSLTRTPKSVQVPNGPSADIARAWSGTLPYDPTNITVPTLLVRGEWDTVSSAEDIASLHRALSAAPVKKAVTLSGGTHVMHLESGRQRLYAEVRSFLGLRRSPATLP